MIITVVNSADDTTQLGLLNNVEAYFVLKSPFRNQEMLKNICGTTIATTDTKVTYSGYSNSQ